MYAVELKLLLFAGTRCHLGSLLKTMDVSRCDKLLVKPSTNRGKLTHCLVNSRIKQKRLELPMPTTVLVVLLRCCLGWGGVFISVSVVKR